MTMGRKVTIPYYRPTFVQKDLSEVGAGTAYPMECTLDQIAEIFYRVKDAWFFGGSTTSDLGTMMTAPGYAPANRSLEIDSVTYQYRGYTKSGSGDYNQAEYDAGMGNLRSDIADNEIGIWEDHWRTPEVNAFSYSADDQNNTKASDPEWFGNGTDGARAEVIVGANVGVVLADPENLLINPANQFFLELEFYYYDYDEILNFGGSTNRIDGALGLMDFYETHFNYVMRIQSGDLSCPFYVGTAGATGWGGTDYIHEAKEWWPYNTEADGSGDPVWDTATGAKL